jgi:hypothetical protein
MRMTRRTVLTVGAAAAAAAAAPGIFAQQPAKTGTGKFYERGPVRIYYEETGSGFPLLLPRAANLRARSRSTGRGSPMRTTSSA